VETPSCDGAPQVGSRGTERDLAKLTVAWMTSGLLAATTSPRPHHAARGGLRSCSRCHGAVAVFGAAFAALGTGEACSGLSAGCLLPDGGTSVFHKLGNRSAEIATGVAKTKFSALEEFEHSDQGL
jgi:hypothetical protein